MITFNRARWGASSSDLWPHMVIVWPPGWASRLFYVPKASFGIALIGIGLCFDRNYNLGRMRGAGIMVDVDRGRVALSPTLLGCL